jgi:hypothetical protein
MNRLRLNNEIACQRGSCRAGESSSDPVLGASRNHPDAVDVILVGLVLSAPTPGRFRG